LCADAKPTRFPNVEKNRFQEECNEGQTIHQTADKLTGTVQLVEKRAGSGNWQLEGDR